MSLLAIEPKVEPLARAPPIEYPTLEAKRMGVRVPLFLSKSFFVSLCFFASLSLPLCLSLSLSVSVYLCMGLGACGLLCWCHPMPPSVGAFGSLGKMW